MILFVCRFLWSAVDAGGVCTGIMEVILLFVCISVYRDYAGGVL
jgi:hypothetical protein